MRANTPITEGYFDATKLFRDYYPDTLSGLKVSHYLDNSDTKSRLITLLPPITEKGRYGFTQLPLEIKEHFTNWIKSTLKEPK